MKHILYKIICFSFLISLFSCEKKEDTVGFGSLHGTVADKNTGNSIRNANVELQDIGLKTTTGSDGKFEFPKVEEGEYWLHVTKSGYREYTSSKITVKGNADPKKADVLLEPLPPALTIWDDVGKEINFIDFGSNDGDVIKSFIIFNNSENKLNWKIQYDCKWITFSGETGELEANQSQAISITINRHKLDIGENFTTIVISSNNGSKEIKIKATSVSIIETLDASDPASHSATLNAKIVRDLQPSICEYGFVYSTLASPSLTNGAMKTSVERTPKVGTFSLLVNNLETNTRYYFRAFATNGSDIVYGEQKEFQTVSHQPDFSISVSTTAATTITIIYRVSDAGIPLQEIGLCWNTLPLPTIENAHQKFGGTANVTYTSTISDLAVYTKYYIRAYAINADGVHYSVEQSVTTDDGKPKVSTSSEVTRGSDFLIVSGEATSEAGMPVMKQGICYSTMPHPTIDDNYVLASSVQDAKFSCRLDGLQSGTKYYFRAFAENNIDIGYGNVQDAYTCYSAKLTGYVYDNLNHPIPSAIIDSPDDDSYMAMTDVNGYYEIAFTFSYNRSHSFRFRASKNGYEEQECSVSIVSGQTTQQNFTLTSENSTSTQQETGSYVTLPDGSLMVQTADKESAQWNSANSSCTASTLGGYTDWRLPTLTELKKIYTYRSQIGGFPSRAVTNNNYWSSTPGSKSGYYYYVNFNDGTSGEMPRVNSFKVRAVRSN